MNKLFLLLFLSFILLGSVTALDISPWDFEYETATGGNLSWNESSAEDLFVNIAGDTMTGDLDMGTNDINNINDIAVTNDVDIGDNLEVHGSTWIDEILNVTGLTYLYNHLFVDANITAELINLTEGIGSMTIDGAGYIRPSDGTAGIHNTDNVKYIGFDVSGNAFDEMMITCWNGSNNICRFEGDITADENITAESFIGDGSYLTGISTYNASYLLNSGDTATGDYNFTSNYLNITGTGGDTPILRLNGNAVNSQSQLQLFESDDLGGWTIRNTGSSNRLDFVDYDGNRLITLESGGPSDSFHIDSAGKVGIGTYTPAGKLDIFTGTTGNDMNIIFKETGASKQAIQFQEVGKSYFSLEHDGSGFNPENLFNIRCANGADGIIDVDSMSFKQNGNVEVHQKLGIGTALPLSEIHSQSANDGDQLLMQKYSSVAGQYTGMRFKMSTNTDNAYVKGGFFFERTGAGGVGKFHFALDSSSDSGNVVLTDSKMTIDSNSGKVGIGTRNPAYLLHLYDSGISTNMYIQSDTAQQSTIYMGTSVGSALYNPANKNELTLWTGSDVLTALDNGNTLVHNNLDVTKNFTGNQIYAEGYYHNHTATGLTFVDGVFYNITLDNFDLNGFSSDDAKDMLIAQVAGKYRTCFMASGDGQNNHIYFTSVFVDNVNQDKCEAHKKMSAGGDIITMTGCCFVDLNVASEITLRTADIGGAGTGNFYSSNLNLERIGN